LEREKLVAGWRGYQCAGSILALADKLGHLGAVGLDIADDSGLNAHGVLQAADRVLPAAAGIGDKLLVGGRERDVAILLLERLVDVLHVEGDALRLAEKLLRALDVLLDLLE